MKLFSILVCLSCIFMVSHVSAISMDVHQRLTKCVTEEVQIDTHAKGTYTIPIAPEVVEGYIETYVEVTLHDPTGHVMYKKFNAPTGSFAFDSSVSGEYKLCFENKGRTVVRVTFDFLVGAESEDLEDLLEDQHLAPIEVELLRIKQAVEEIHSEMISKKKLEGEMRNINESTNSRVVWYSILSMVILLSLGVWQLIYLRSFFQKRKLI